MDYYNPYFKMGYCSVPFCDYFSNTNKGFSVPFKNPVRWQQWISACPFLLNYSSKEIKHARICKKHFLPQHIIEYNKLTPDAVPSLHLPLPLNKFSGDSEPQSLPSNGLSGDSKPQLNKPVEQQLTDKVKPSLNTNIEVRNQDKKLVIEPIINVAEFSRNPSSFIYVPSNPKNSNEKKSVGINTHLVNLPDCHQESISVQKTPSSIMSQNYNIIQGMPQIINLDKQYLTQYNPYLYLFNNTLAEIPETSQLADRNSNIVQKDLKTRHFGEQDSVVKEESCFDNINECMSRLKNICYACLSEDRNLTKLAEVNDGINNLLYLVSCNEEAYEELSNYVHEVYICWECKALMNRFCKFRDQVCMAQKQLKEINGNKYKNLSKLSEHHQNFYNYEIDSTNVTDTLKSKEDLTCDELNSLPWTKQNGKKRNYGYIVDNNKHYLTIQMSASELSEDMHERKSDPNFIATTHKCTTCIKTFKDEQELNMHVTDYHKKPVHVMCYICEAYVKYEWHKEHSDGHFVKYKCHSCYEDFYSSLEILEHLYETHNVKDTYEEIIKQKLHSMKELRVKPLVLYSPNARTFCYVCSRCNQCYVSKTEIKMRCEPCNKILETIEPKYGENTKVRFFGENYANENKILKEKIKFEPNDKMQTQDDVHRKTTSFGDKLLCGKREKKYVNGTTKHIIYDHGYAKTLDSNHDRAKTDNNESLFLKLDSNNTDTGQINIQNGSDEANLKIECKKEYPDIVKSISGQDDIETVEINDIENVQNVRYAIYNLSEFLKIHTDKSNYEETHQETNVTEQITEETKEKTDITEEIMEIKTEITESETKVTDERSEEDFILDPDHPTNKIISKYEAHYTVIKMTVTEMQDSLKQRKLMPKFTEAMYKCELCIEIFNSHQERQAHTVLVHMKPSSTIPHTLCNICKVYIKDRYYKEHKYNHFLKYFCRYCDYVASNILVVLKHLNKAHACKAHSRPEEKWLKRRLQLTNPGTRPLNVDMSANEHSNLGYICLICEELFTTLDLRNKHNRLYHYEYRHRVITTPKRKCFYCKKTFRRLTKLKEHELKHKMPPVHKSCPICGKEVTNMTVHMRVHRRIPMSCAECDRVYPSRIAYLNHLKYTTLHSGDKVYRYQCNLCDKRFIKKSSRRDHINYTHRGIGFECSLCHKMFASTAHLANHMDRVHRGVNREYLCPTCGIVCKTRHILRDHELFHSGGHVTCDVCGGEFRKYSSLNNHKYHVHKNERPKEDAVVVEIIEE